MTGSLQDRRGGCSRRAQGVTLAAAIFVVVAFAAATAASATTYTVREHTVFGTVRVSTLSEVVGVSAGGGCPGGEESSCGDFNLARLSSGTVETWGYNGSGQLGNGTVNSSTEPVAVTGLSGVTATAAGWSHSLALLSNGTVKAWGYGGNGGLGQGSFTSSDVPVTVSGLNGVAAIAAGAGDSLALLSNGKVMAWGYNEWGQVGDGTTTNKAVPSAVNGLSGVIAIAAGRYFSLALLSNGRIMAWGYDANGELGNFLGPCETWPGCDTPVEVGEISEVTAISGGLAHSLSLLNNGTVKAWGSNNVGQLGNGSTKGSTAPVAATGLNSATAIAAASWSSYAMRSDGSAFYWGYGTDAPAALSSFNGAVGIAAGGAHGVAYGPFATVASVTPAAGPIAGGTPVSISGTNLGGATAVRFGSTNAASFTVNSETSITAVAPAQTAGEADVTVTTPVDTSLPVSFTYVPPPVVGKVSPKSGSVAGGTPVTITGKNFTYSNFTETTAVNFGSTPASSFKVNYSGSITAVTPAETEGKVAVTVTTASGGSSAISLADYFKFVPTVTSLSPNSGSKAGGTSVTITGVGFALGKTATKVRFGGTTASKSVNCTSTTECSVVAPAHAVGTVDVKVTVNKQSSSKSAPADQFTYN